MPDSDGVVLLDTETTDLGNRAQITEVAWHSEGVDEPNEVWSLRWPHDTLVASQDALDIQNYHLREMWDSSRWAMPEELEEFREALRGKTVCTANVHFDMSILERYGCDVWHYRPLDFTSWAAGRMGWAKRSGMIRTYERMRGAFGDGILGPGHPAAGDVRSMLSMRRVLLGL